MGDVARCCRRAELLVESHGAQEAPRRASCELSSFRPVEFRYYTDWRLRVMRDAGLKTWIAEVGTCGIRRAALRRVFPDSIQRGVTFKSPSQRSAVDCGPAAIDCRSLGGRLE